MTLLKRELCIAPGQFPPRTFSESIWFFLKQSAGQNLRKVHCKSCGHHRGLPISRPSVSTRESRVGARWAKRVSERKVSGSAGLPSTDSASPLLSEVEKGVPQAGLITGMCAHSPQIESGTFHKHPCWKHDWIFRDIGISML
jgi:hypothetical protein